MFILLSISNLSHGRSLISLHTVVTSHLAKELIHIHLKLTGSVLHIIMPRPVDNTELFLWLLKVTHAAGIQYKLLLNFCFIYTPYDLWPRSLLVVPVSLVHPAIMKWSLNNTVLYEPDTWWNNIKRRWLQVRISSKHSFCKALLSQLFYVTVW